MPIDPVNPILVIMVKRESIVDHTLNQIMKCGPYDLKKPLKVICCYNPLHLESNLYVRAPYMAKWGLQICLREYNLARVNPTKKFFQYIQTYEYARSATADTEKERNIHEQAP